MNSLINTILIKQVKKAAGTGFLKFYSTELPKYETLAVSTPKKHVYHVELNRPKKSNALNNKMWLEIKACFEALSVNPDCRVVLLSAIGKNFTAGIDLNSLIETGTEANTFDDVARKGRYWYKTVGQAQDCITALEKCVKPVVSVIHSACVGAGVDLITAADIRYCTEDAWFQVKEVDVGLAADVGTLQRLPKAIGSASIARELCFTARKFEAKEAKEIGLVSEVYSDRDVAIEKVLGMCEQIAQKSPVAVQVTKQAMVYSQSRTNEEGLLYMRLMNQMMLQSEDLTNSAIAQATKSGPPEFENM